MRKGGRWLLPAAILLAGAAPRGCSREPEMEELLRARPALAAVAAEAERYRLQVVLGTVEPGQDGRPRLVQRGVRLGAEYFYPASTVKMFAAVAALEELARLRLETGLPLDRDTPLAFHPLTPGGELEQDDPSNLRGGMITVGHEIRKLFLVSDNVAFNHLFELVGSDGIAASMTRAGIPDALIIHRLAEVPTPGLHRRMPHIDFVGQGFRHALPEREVPALPPLPEIPGLSAGRAFLDGDQRIERPFDFRPKNRIALADLQRGLCKIVRPEVDCGGPGFLLSEEDRAFLVEAMTQFPRESQNPRYDPAEYPDAYVKYLLPGLEKVVPREHLAISNKVGQAYGFLTENAYVRDVESGRSVFVAATLYVNEDGVLNDNRYEYDTIGFPFFAALGEVVAEQFLSAPPP